MSDYKTFFNFVTQRPLPAEQHKCPYCGATENLNIYESRSTLLAGGQDVNHVTEFVACNTCNTKFVVNSHLRYQWYEDLDCRVLKGMPNCWEPSILTHAGCGGEVHRRYTQLDGTQRSARWLQVKINEDGSRTKNYRTFWKCKSCNAEIETQFDSWMG